MIVRAPTIAVLHDPLGSRCSVCHLGVSFQRPSWQGRRWFLSVLGAQALVQAVDTHFPVSEPLAPSLCRSHSEFLRRSREGCCRRRWCLLSTRCSVSVCVGSVRMPCCTPPAAQRSRLSTAWCLSRRTAQWLRQGRRCRCSSLVARWDHQPAAVVAVAALAVATRGARTP
jgi:hypothetical protein